jgi:hypothetical protein
MYLVAVIPPLQLIVSFIALILNRHRRNNIQVKVLWVVTSCSVAVGYLLSEYFAAPFFRVK